MEQANIPLTPENPDQKKEKKKSDTEGKSRFEKLQAALERAIETLLSKDNKGDSGAKKEQQLEPVKANQEKNDEGLEKSVPQPGAAQPDLEQIAASLRLHHPSTEQLGSNHLYYEEVEENHKQIDQKNEISNRRIEDKSNQQSTELLLDVDPIEGLWQRARSRIQNFFRRHAAAETGSDKNETNTPKVEDNSIEQPMVSNLETSGSDPTITELQQYFRENTRPVETSSIKTEQQVSPVAAVYAVINELRQRRNRKKLEQLARDQRQQKRELKQTQQQLSKVQMGAPQATKNILTYEHTERGKVKTTSLFLEQRNGEIRLDYPPAPETESTDAKSLQRPENTNQKIIANTDKAPVQNARTDRYKRPRSDAAKSVGEIIEQRTPSPEQLEQTEAASNEQLEKTDNRYLNSMPYTMVDYHSAGVGQEVEQRSPTGSINTINQLPTQNPRMGTRVNIETKSWQQAVLIVINLLLIALLVGELVF